MTYLEQIFKKNVTRKKDFDWLHRKIKEKIKDVNSHITSVSDFINKIGISKGEYYTFLKNGEHFHRALSKPKEGDIIHRIAEVLGENYDVVYAEVSKLFLLEN